jgi:hypothetical protein
MCSTCSRKPEACGIKAFPGLECAKAVEIVKVPSNSFCPLANALFLYTFQIVLNPRLICMPPALAPAQLELLRHCFRQM